jgi:hypothetical protein
VIALHLPAVGRQEHTRARAGVMLDLRLGNFGMKVEERLVDNRFEYEISELTGRGLFLSGKQR